MKLSGHDVDILLNKVLPFVIMCDSLMTPHVYLLVGWLIRWSVCRLVGLLVGRFVAPICYNLLKR